MLLNIINFFNELQQYKKLNNNPTFSLKLKHLYPCLTDKTSETPIEPIYFIQGVWCAGQLAKSNPKKHVDVGSSAILISLISQFIPTTMVDIRPLPILVPGLQFVKGNILSLPFKSETIHSLSSICVIEHIGLGRYGDALDPWGTEKAIAELTRVLEKNGDLYLSVPVDNNDSVHFNAHRCFTRDTFLKLCTGLSLINEQYIYGLELFKKYIPRKGFGTGLFSFKKR